MHRTTRSSSDQVRRGAIAPFLIISMSVFLAAFALAVNKGWLWSVREDLRTSADAAALAAMQSFIDDDLLRGDMNRYPDLLTRATEAAFQYASINPVRGQPLRLLDNSLNDPQGDVVFGMVSAPRAGDFAPVPGRTFADDLQARTNAVVVHARLTRTRGTAPGLIFGVFAGHTAADVQAVSAAAFDRGIRGFRPMFGANVPLAPIAILSDTTGTNPKSWESIVELKTGPDVERFDKMTNAFIADPAGDLIHEYIASYATKVDQLPVANVVLLHLGTSDLSRIASQLSTGISSDDLNFLGGKLELPVNDGIDIGGQLVGPEGDQPEILELAAARIELKTSAAVRIWPLYSTVSLGQVHVTGFVAARVVSVIPPTADTPLVFTLQATVISRPDAITDTDLRGRDATMNGNLYIGKIRRVE